MHICEKCYDKDRKIVECPMSFMQHYCTKSKCDVCGKLGIVADCWAYDYTTDPWADAIMGKLKTGGRIMYVCKECHERDRRMISCKTPFDYHHLHIRSTCDICGKFEMLSECLAYSIKAGINTRKIKCLSVDSATSETK